MTQFPSEFYNPLSLALNGGRLQDFVDEILASYNGLKIDGFTWNNDLLPDFTYNQIQRELKMEVMAQYVDLDSPAIPVGAEGDIIGSGSIPRMKAVEYYNEAKLRKLKQMENRRDISREELINNAGANIGEIIMKLVMRHTNAITYQRHQIVSNGKFVLTNTNNPNGIVNVTFANHTPSANTTTLADDKRWWTNATHDVAHQGSASNVIVDLQAMVKVAKRKGVARVHFEINDDFLDDVLNHTSVTTAIAANLYPSAASADWAKAAAAQLARDQKVEILGRIIGAPIKSWDTQVSVEKWDDSTKKLTRPQFEAFNKDVVVLVPDGNIGEILTVEPILLAGGEYAYAYGRKLAITIDKDFAKKCMSYNSEMTSLAVPNVPQYLWYIKPCQV